MAGESPVSRAPRSFSRQKRPFSPKTKKGLSIFIQSSQVTVKGKKKRKIKRIERK
jgi:hypothetical protein